MNTTSFIGRLGADPELRYTPNGKAVTDLNLAVDDGWGENKKTAWVPVTIWGNAAELACRHVSKGDRLAITGRITQESWQDKNTGKAMSKLKIVCDTMTLIERKQESAPARTQNPPQEDNDYEDDIPF